MSEFKSYHPIVSFSYFAAVIAFSMCLMHPACLFISFLSGAAYSVMLGGKKTLKHGLFFLAPTMLLSALINPAFNHEGVTILAYFPNGNPLTMESILYGIGMAAMVAGVICRFSGFNKIMTSDKLMFLFGKVIPSFSLIFSMTLRFVPRFKARIKTISAAQKCIGRDISDGNIFERARNGIKILSVMISWSLENAIDTADSMKSRGYGIKNRSAYSDFRFDGRDLKAFLFIAVSAVYILTGCIEKKLYFRYFPSIKAAQMTPYGVSVIFAYMLLSVYPIIVEIREALRWKKLRSKI